MSKEKLQEIWDNYTVGDKEYLNQLSFIGNDVGQLMKLAYNKALSDFSLGITKYEYDLKDINKLLTELKVK